MLSTGPGRAWGPILSCLVVVAVVACGRGPEGSRADRPEAPGDAERITVEIGSARVLAWDPVDAAVRYRVRAWSGTRLLFDVVTWEPRLETTPALERTLQFYSDAVLRIEALDVAGERRGEVLEVAVPPGGAR